MRRMFRYVDTAPWLAAIAAALLISTTAAARSWPMLIAGDFGPLVQWAFLGPVGLITARVRRRRAGRGPDRTVAALSTEEVGRLRRGYVPGDLAERQRISRLLTADITQACQLGWLVSAGLTGLGTVIVVAKSGQYPGRPEWVTAAWLLLVTAVFLCLVHRVQNRRRRVLQRLSMAAA